MELIDIENWNRKEHFEFFSRMASPYFGITTEVDCTQAFEIAKELGRSFFAHYMHKSQVAVNAVDELKLRIVDGNVVKFDAIHTGSTVGRKDGTFGLIFVHFDTDFDIFNAEMQREIDEVQNSTGLRLNNEDLKKDLIRYSTFPWHSFTSLLHPTHLDKTESVPKITFGKFSIRDGRKFMPVSVEAHHGLCDGIHIAKYLTEFQKQLDLP